MKRIRTKFKGVYQREAEKQNHKGKPDICFDISYKIDGKKIWEKAGWLSEGYSPKLAEQVRAERIRSIRHGEELPQEKKKTPTFKEAAAKYIEWAKKEHKSGKDEESRYTYHLRPEFDDKRLDEISPFDIEKFKIKATKSGRIARKDDKGRKAEKQPGLSPQTIKHCIALMRQIYNKAIDWEIYDGPNPVRKVEMPKVKNGRVRFLSHDEADKLLAELRGRSETTYDMAVISLHCGLRSGEILNLKGKDVDFPNGKIHILEPKNGEYRTADMTRAVNEIFKARMPESPEEYVFKDRRHNKKIDQVSQAFTKAVDAIGLNEGVTNRLEKVTFHTLRHTFASWLVLQGESLLMIASLLGHKTLAMVQRYAHLMPGKKKEAVLKLEKAFNESQQAEKDEDLNLAG